MQNPRHSQKYPLRFAYKQPYLVIFGDTPFSGFYSDNAQIPSHQSCVENSFCFSDMPVNGGAHC